MKNKLKKALSILLAVCITACLAGCKGNDSSNSTSSVVNNETKQVTYTLLSGYILGINKVSVGNGYYDIETNTDGSANMMYTDCATAHRMFLSSDVNSAHNTADDTSYLQYMLGGIKAIGTPNYLYALKIGKPSMVEKDGEEGRSYLEQMTYGGENHRRLYLADTACFSINGQLAYDGENIICVVINYNKGNDLMYDSECEQYIAAINEETGKEERLYTFGDDFTYSIVGTSGEKLFVKGFRQIVNTESGERRAEYKMLSINPQTKEEKQIYFCEGFENNTQWLSYQQVMCRYDFEKNQLIAISADGVESVMCENVIPDIEQYTEGHLYCEKPWDNNIIFRASNDEYSKCFALNMNTKTVTELNTYIDDEFIAVETICDEYFMVLYGEYDIPYTTVDDEGIVWEHNYMGKKRWIIKKEDYWAGNMELIEVTDDYTPR